MFLNQVIPTDQQKEGTQTHPEVSRTMANLMVCYDCQTPEDYRSLRKGNKKQKKNRNGRRVVGAPRPRINLGASA